MQRNAIPVYLVFLVMGFGDLIGPLVSLVKEKLQISQFEASFIAFAGFIMFGTLSIPVGVFQKQHGKKATTIVGLILVLMGLCTPVVGLTSYAGYLTAVLLLGAGVTILQVAGSPLLHEVSPPGSFARNLTFGQFIKGIGTLSSPLIPIIAYRYFNNRWELVFPAFAIASAITLLIMLRFRDAGKTESAASFRECFALLAHGRVSLMVLGIFLYVGAEVCMSSMLPSILEKKYGYTLSDYGMAGTGLFFVALMSGRFGGTFVLSQMRPASFFILSCAISLAGLILLAAGSGPLGFIAAALIGLGFANIFPLVFSITIEAYPDRASELSGLMVSAIAGGAIIPPLMGYLSEQTSLVTALVVPALCLVYLTALALNEVRKHGSAV